MQIVSQSATALYSLIPPFPLLSSPPVHLVLPAPKPTIIVEKHTRLDDLFEKVGPIRSIEEMNAEIDALADMLGGRARRIWDMIKVGSMSYER